MADNLARILTGLGLAVREDGHARAAEDPPAGDFTADVTPPSRAELTRDVTRDEALTLDGIYRAFLVLQTAVTQLSIDVWRGADQLPEPPLVIRQPHPDTDLGQHLALTVTSLAGHGNAYWRIYRDRTTGQASVLEVLDPNLVHVATDDRGQVTYHHRGDELPRRDVSHLRLMHLTGTPYGLGPIQAARRSLRRQLAQGAYADSWFDQSTTPEGILTTDQELDPETAEEYKKRWAAQNGPGKGVAVLGHGMGFTPFMLKPADLQWLESQNLGTIQIARLWGIPARQMLVGIEGDSLTYANMEQEEMAFVRYTLMAYLREIESAFTRLIPRGQTARFNTDALLRTDTKTRYEAHEIALRAKFLTVPEVRAIEGLPELDQLPTIPADQETAP